MAKIAVIGAGFSGLSAAAYLAEAGHEVHLFEKNAAIGGRARQLKTDNGYTFDMGPSWYWMPEVFENFFQDFGLKVTDFYQLELLDPGFEMVFSGEEKLKIPADYKMLGNLFDSLEKEGSSKLDAFMEEAKYKYNEGMLRLAYMPGDSILEFANIKLLKSAMKMQVFSSFSKHVRKYFSNSKLIALMEFPVLFLGAMPQDTPALYSLMNYAGLKLGTWYPKGGFSKVVEAMQNVALSRHVQFYFDCPVEKIITKNDKVSSIKTKNGLIDFDAVIASADYHHVENDLLEKQSKNYDENYWQKKTFAPSCLIFYVGIKKKLSKLLHHTLFFDEDMWQHAKDIYKNPQWPAKPLFYACCSSRTDADVAPTGHENLFLLMPIAAGLVGDDETTLEKYFEIMMSRLSLHIGEPILPFIDYKKSYCVADFKMDYNAYKGNAYGLANTLNQTAILKPKMRNKKIKNLFYAGQLTVPGPGVPPSIISGKIAAELLIKQLNA
ncbi:phytoene desaturase family protein [Arachidicoccus soli]|uniref:Phytoene desaturase n=1 Tax=Arachidicoccus soli TaxID=2341117 RepID=A0A386HPY6_9BACT|nr:phytoene desaturase family protein [Arachidicoccus soli]AYD47833.1 phytoene desaturase [Arachidicoccus soli]